MSKFIVKKESLKMSSVIDWVLMLLIFGVITVILNVFSYGKTLNESIPGILILVGITFVGVMLEKLIPIKIPAIIYISLIALIIALPFTGAVGEYVFASANSISTLGMCTVILAYSGVAIGKSWADFKKMGWRGIAVTLCVILGTFLGSALIAQIILKAQGII